MIRPAGLLQRSARRAKTIVGLTFAWRRAAHHLAERAPRSNSIVVRLGSRLGIVDNATPANGVLIRPGNGRTYRRWVAMMRKHQNQKITDTGIAVTP